MDTPPLRIHITSKDLREGEPGEASACPAARATARAVKRVMKTEVDHVTVISSVVAHVPMDDGGWVNHWWLAPPALMRLIAAFDRHETTKPGSFIIRPGVSQNLGSTT